MLNVKQAAVIRHINAILLSSHASTSVCAAHLSPGNSIPYTPDTAAESFRLRRRWKCKDRKIRSFPAISFRQPNGCRSERKAVMSRLICYWDTQTACESCVLLLKIVLFSTTLTTPFHEKLGCVKLHDKNLFTLNPLEQAFYFTTIAR